MSSESDTTVTQQPYWNPYFAGIALGGVLLGSFLVTGHGLGASGGLARLGAFGACLISPSYTNHTRPLAELACGSNSALDHWIVFAILGTFLGGMISGKLAGRFKMETCKGPQIGDKTRWVMAFLGGSLMGFGARLGRGCTSGQALSGGAVLSVGSWAFMLSVFAGGYLLAYPFRKFWN
jgi:uncharacterized membrane protein YedE/YeeE